MFLKNHEHCEHCKRIVILLKYKIRRLLHVILFNIRMVLQNACRLLSCKIENSMYFCVKCRNYQNRIAQYRKQSINVN